MILSLLRKKRPPPEQVQKAERRADIARARRDAMEERLDRELSKLLKKEPRDTA